MAGKPKITKKCLQCGKYFSIYETRHWESRPHVCSPACFVKFIHHLTPFKRERKLICSHRIKPQYKSKLEVAFANFLKANEIEFDYEKYLLVDEQSTIYLPDFYLPKKNIFIEVKGSIAYDRLYKYKRFKDCGVILLIADDFRRLGWKK